MDNRSIVKILDHTAILMDLHEETAQKVKSFSNAVFNLERLGRPLVDLTMEELLGINGVGKGIAAAIDEIRNTGGYQTHSELIEKTPEGVLELLAIRGVGAAKVKTAWKSMDIDSVEKMLEACENRSIETLKGFGAKTVENLKGSIKFYLENKNKRLISEARELGNEYTSILEECAPDAKVSFTGPLRRNMEVVDKISVLLGSDDRLSYDFITGKLPQFVPDKNASGPFAVRGKDNSGVEIEILLCGKDEFDLELFRTTGSEDHFRALEAANININGLAKENGAFTEGAFYERHGMDFVPPELREGTFEVARAKEDKLPNLLKNEDLKGILHTHSTYSDGANTLREMAEACRDLGYGYLGIADHSKSAFYYANGLFEERVIKQHEEIDKLNEEMAPFKIFKGIESDILTDGSLDYSDDVLASFDFIVASVHSGLSMEKDRATARLLRAIDNPYTTIMGHLTGRVLLQREGFPLDHKLVIDRCAKNKVAIEVNAHPSRLDLDWRWIHYALEKGVMLSVNPDSHTTEGLKDMKYGVAVARKGGITAKQTLNAMTAEEIADFFNKRKQRI